MELWLIPSGGRPQSLGLIVREPAGTAQGAAGTCCASQHRGDARVSLEPLGGSPTGQPTGPVIANGKLAAL